MLSSAHRLVFLFRTIFQVLKPFSDIKILKIKLIGTSDTNNIKNLLADTG